MPIGTSVDDSLWRGGCPAVRYEFQTSHANMKYTLIH
jgi:hypothetical protein